MTSHPRNEDYQLIIILLTYYQLYDIIRLKVGEAMGNSVVEDIEQVIIFLQALKQVLCSESFDCERDLDILLSKKTDPHNAGYTTAETLAVLGYNKKDICDELLALSEHDYYETVIDDIDPTLPKFYSFGKTIQAREIYIKVKIRDKLKGTVFCVSFHFAKYPMLKPYAI